MSRRVPPEKKAEWKQRASIKQAIVPNYFKVFPRRVIIICGKCSFEFQRNLIKNVNEPVFTCPNESCKGRNWIPLKFE